jgi:hypothetical protein
VIGADVVDLPSDVRVLDLPSVATDGIDPAALAPLLRRWGFLVASEREFHGRGETFDRVLARTLVFTDPAGAGRYLAWIASHPEHVLGPCRSLRPLGLGVDPVLFEMERCGTCRPQLPTFLAIWRRGSSVRYLLASGDRASRRTLEPVAVALDRL